MVQINVTPNNPNTKNFTIGGVVQPTSGGLGLQGSSPRLQPSATPQKTGNVIQPATSPFGTPGTTSPARDQFVNNLAKAPAQTKDLSADFGLSNGTVFDKKTNQPFRSKEDFFRDTGNTSFAGLKFDESFDPNASQTPTGSPETGFSGLGGPQVPQGATTRRIDPFLDTYKQAFTDYIATLAPSAGVKTARTKFEDFVTSAQSGIAGLEGQGRGIPLQLVRGQQAKLGEQAEITASRLQKDVGIATDEQKAFQAQALAKLGFAEAEVSRIQDENDAEADQEKVALEFAQANNITTQFFTSAGITFRTSDLQPFKNKQEAFAAGVAQDFSNAPTIKGLPQKPVSLSAGASLVDPATGRIIVTAPKSGTGSGGGSLSSLAQTVLANPALFNQLTPTVKGKIATELAGGGFTGFGKSLSDTALVRVTDSENALTALQDLRATIEGNERFVGPLKGLQALNPFSEAKQIQAEIAAVRQRVGKALEGGVLRKEDEIKYKKILATINDTPATAISKIDFLVTSVTRDIESFINNQSAAGRNVEGIIDTPTNEQELRVKYDY